MAYRVLIVDDSPSMRAFAPRAMEISGLDVESRTHFRLDSPRLISEGEWFTQRNTTVRSLNLWNGNLTVTLDTDSYVSG